MHKPLIHIGHHKTSTTTLQKNVFSDESIFYPLGRYGNGGDLCRSEDFRQLIWEDLYLDRLNFEKKLPHYKSLCDKLISEAELIGKIPVVSNEMFCTPYMIGSVEIETVFQRLKILFGDANILFFTRNQESWLKSFYSTLVADWGSTLSYADFCYININVPLHPCNFFRALDYAHIYERAKEYFSNVHIYPAEKLFADYSGMLSEILNDLNINIDTSFHLGKENQSKNKIHIDKCREINKIISHNYSDRRESLGLSPNSSIFRGICFKAQSNIPLNTREVDIYLNVQKQIMQRNITLNSKESVDQLCTLHGIRVLNKQDIHSLNVETLKEFFSASNAKLSRIMQIDLSEHGYVVG